MSRVTTWAIIVVVGIVGIGSYYIYFLYLKNQCIQNLEARLQSDNIIINFSSKPDEYTLEKFKAELERLPSARSITLLSSDETLKRFIEKHKGKKDVIENVQNLKESPLPPKITVVMNSSSSADNLVSAIYNLGEKYNLPTNIDGPYAIDLRIMIKNVSEKSFFENLGENFSNLKMCARKIET